MKKKLIPVALILTIAGSMLMSSCIGSFKLTNNLLAWNKTVGNKFLNELVFVAFWVLPVYEVTALADVLVLNSIEFWSGNNPVAQGKSLIKGNDATYLVDCDGKGYTITSQTDGSVVRLDFNTQLQSWSVVTDAGSYELMTFVDEHHVRLPLRDGGSIVVETSQEGYYAYLGEVSHSLWAKN
ncbi:MAG: DUF3332 domain-containing protein [Paramuribaculum sp.]|nr:DUF3332 domain-containing protein [Paramuribaculum sp.]